MSESLFIVLLSAACGFMIGYSVARLQQLKFNVFDLFKYPPRTTTPAPLPKSLGAPTPSSDAVTKAHIDQMIRPLYLK